MIFFLIFRHLRDVGYAHSITGSDLFESSRSVLAARKRELKGCGLGNWPNKADTITAEIIEKMCESGELALHELWHLQDLSFHVNMPKDPLSSPLLGIYFTFAFKSKGLKGDLFVIFT